MSTFYLKEALQSHPPHLEDVFCYRFLSEAERIAIPQMACQSWASRCGATLFVVIVLLRFTHATSATTPSSPPKRSSLHAQLHTDYGVIEFELLPDDAPMTVLNFVNLSKSGFYNHTYFYRYVKDFVIQGGGYYANQTSNVTVPLEYKVPNEQWTVGLARNNAPDTGSSEYYINLVNNSASLAPGGVTPNGYCVFARISGGFDVITKLMALPIHYNSVDGTTEYNPPWPLVEYIDILEH